MRALTDADFLALWENGFHRHPLDRALLALLAAFPEMTCERLAAWPIGRRNQALAGLRCRCFGPRLRGWMACTKCGEKLEFEMDAQLLASKETVEESRTEQPVMVNGRIFRLPTSRDLARAVDETDSLAGAVRIVESCLMGPSPPAEWSEEELSAIGAKLALADPGAETLLSLHCPNCGNEWQESLDIVLFFWSEAESRVRRVLAAVHTLASAYGWSEEQILSLSENRRALYLEMVQS